MTDHARAALDRLARACGILTSYTHASGETVRSSPESLLAGLSALGTDLASPSDAPAALAARTALAGSSPLPAVSVAWLGEGRPLLMLRPDSPEAGAELKAVLRLENGTERRMALRPARRRKGARTGPRSQIPYGLPADLPPGYHEIELENGSRHPTGGLIAAPRQAYEPPGQRRKRGWGVFMPLYGVVTGRTWGVADYSDLDAAVEWTADQGGDAFGTLPLLPAFLEAPFEPSPYAPVSRTFWNELYVDPRATPEFSRCDEARRLIASGEREANALRDAPLLDYRRAWSLRRPIFEALAGFGSRQPESAARTEEFRRAHPEVEQYAAFRAACDQHGGGWLAWPDRLKAGSLTSSDFRTEDQYLYVFLQRAAHEQLEAVGRRKSAGGTGLYLDLPIGVNRDGFDVWANQRLFAAGASVGAPPDLFFSGGQDWGFPPPLPDRMADDRFNHWRSVVRHHTRFATMLRVDHVMGLHRLFVIPQGMSPKDGVYVRFPSEEMYAVLTIESNRARAMVVGEDLGTVPHYVGPAMRGHNIRQMYAAYFQIQPKKDPSIKRPTRNMVAFMNTHDMPTFKAFWEGDDTRLRKKLGIIDARGVQAELAEKRDLKTAVEGLLREKAYLNGSGAEAVLNAYLEWLARSPAAFLLINLEDLWLETMPQNVPGTTDQHPNWRPRARHPLEAWTNADNVAQVLGNVRRARVRSQKG